MFKLLKAIFNILSTLVEVGQLYADTWKAEVVADLRKAQEDKPSE